MKPFREILFPTDFSQAAASMAPYAREMAQRFSAHVTVVHALDFAPAHAVPYHFSASCEMEGGLTPYTPELQQHVEELQRQLEEVTDTQFSSVRHTAMVECGDPATVIEWIARQERADIIIMPTTGHGRFRRLLLGSITAKVLHDLPCPVLTSAHQPEASLPGVPMAGTPGFRSVLCAVEMNPELDDILDAGVFLAQTYGARLCIVHMQSAPTEGNEGEDAESIELSFEQALHRYANDRVEMRVRLLDASVPQGIRRMAIAEAADLVVVGRGHQRGTVSRLWSPLYTIIRESPCPVLSV